MSIKDIPKKIKPYLAERVYPLISQIKSGFDIKEDIFIMASNYFCGPGWIWAGEIISSGEGERTGANKAGAVYSYCLH